VNKSGSFELFSLTPGTPPGGPDLPPGSFPFGFLFRFKTRTGPIPFTAAFVNPKDPNDPLIYNGTGEPAGYRVYLPMVLK
jgi:hypothetical protein